MWDTLSQRECEVLELLIQGLANKQIALKLSISTKRVEKICTSIYQKIGVDSRASPIVWALRQEKDGRGFPTL